MTALLVREDHQVHVMLMPSIAQDWDILRGKLSVGRAMLMLEQRAALLAPT